MLSYPKYLVITKNNKKINSIYKNKESHIALEIKKKSQRRKAYAIRPKKEMRTKKFMEKELL